MMHGMNMLKKLQNLTLFVPGDIAGYIVGKGGCNIERWKKELGVKKITVVGK